MARYKRFTFLCNRDERRMLEALAKHLQRSQSDTVRLLVRGAMRELEQGGLLPAQEQAQELGTTQAQAVEQ